MSILFKGLPGKSIQKIVEMSTYVSIDLQVLTMCLHIDENFQYMFIDVSENSSGQRL